MKSFGNVFTKQMSKSNEKRFLLSIKHQYLLMCDVESRQFSTKEIMIKYKLKNQCNFIFLNLIIVKLNVKYGYFTQSV